jgi:hypothetical protein
MNKQITLSTNSLIKDLHPEYLKMLFKFKKDVLPLNGNKVNVDIKYITKEKPHYFVRIFDINFNSIDDLIKAILHFTKYGDQELVYKKIFIRFSTIKTN